MAKGRKTGGRLRGSLNKATVEIREAARLLLEDPSYRLSLRSRLINGKAGLVETLLFHCAYGKPKETVEQAGAQKIVICWQDSDDPATRWTPPTRTEPRRPG